MAGEGEFLVNRGVEGSGGAQIFGKPYTSGIDAAIKQKAAETPKKEKLPMAKLEKIKSYQVDNIRRGGELADELSDDYLYLEKLRAENSPDYLTEKAKFEGKKTKYVEWGLASTKQGDEILKMQEKLDYDAAFKYDEESHENVDILIHPQEFIAKNINSQDERLRLKAQKVQEGLSEFRNDLDPVVSFRAKYGSKYGLLERNFYADYTPKTDWKALTNITDVSGSNYNPDQALQIDYALKKNTPESRKFVLGMMYDIGVDKTSRGDLAYKDAIQNGFDKQLGTTQQKYVELSQKSTDPNEKGQDPAKLWYMNEFEKALAVTEKSQATRNVRGAGDKKKILTTVNTSDVWQPFAFSSDKGYGTYDMKIDAKAQIGLPKPDQIRIGLLFNPATGVTKKDTGVKTYDVVEINSATQARDENGNLFYINPDHSPSLYATVRDMEDGTTYVTTYNEVEGTVEGATDFTPDKMKTQSSGKKETDKAKTAVKTKQNSSTKPKPY